MAHEYCRNHDLDEKAEVNDMAPLSDTLHSSADDVAAAALADANVA